MQHCLKKIIQEGDENGNEMVVQFQLPSGLEIYGLATRNFEGGNWDLGPTWNYMVMADKPFLVDSGRYGQGKKLINMIKATGLKPEDLDFVLVSHGHEDHDGGLAEHVKEAGLRVKAHTIYGLQVQRYPEKAPDPKKQDFPAKCWHCFMPESFYTKNCLAYHRVLNGLKVDPIGNGKSTIAPNIETYHLPGHNPDCLVTCVGNEALIVGDIILPDITPWPTCEAFYDGVANVLKPEGYNDPAAIFGLKRYIISLNKLKEYGSRNPDIIVFPAHRLYYQGRWNWFRLNDRIDELIEHHVRRCGAIIDILQEGPQSAEEIAKKHFEHRLLQGPGKEMAANEIISHCELLIHSGDVKAEGKKYAVTGSVRFEEAIRDLLRS